MCASLRRGSHGLAAERVQSTPKRTCPRDGKTSIPISAYLVRVDEGMLLIALIILFLLFGGLGFALHVLWIVAVIALIVAVIHGLTRSRN
jgi:hypothetical protein